MTLITVKDVIDISLTNKNVNTFLIKEKFIEIAQEDHIRPLLTADLYDDIIKQKTDNTLTADNNKLLTDFIKPALAFFVKYEILPDLIMQTSTKGARILNDEFSVSISDKQRADFLTKIKDHAESLGNIMVRFIDDNKEKYPLYKSNLSVAKTTKVFGGIVMDDVPEFVSKENER